jgi:hypothetical protein
VLHGGGRAAAERGLQVVLPGQRGAHLDVERGLLQPPALLVERLVLRAQLLLELPPLADVTDRAAHEQAGARLERAQADLDRELAPVATPPDQPRPGAHRPHARVGEVAFAPARVHLAEALRDEELDGPADQLRARVAEEPLGLLVDEHDLAAPIDDDDRVGRRLEQLPVRPRIIRDGAHRAFHSRRADRPENPSAEKLVNASGDGPSPYRGRLGL